MSIPPAIQKRKRNNRIVGWAIFYILVFGAFLIFVYAQGRQIPTYALPDGRIALSTDKTMYAVGDTITYSIANGLSSPITLLNYCPQEPLHVYQWQNGAWVRIHDTQDAVSCPEHAKPIRIAAHTTYTATYAKWPHLFHDAGIYRIVTFATNYPDLPYADFIVAKPAANTPVQAPTIIYQPIYIPVPTNGGDGGGDN